MNTRQRTREILLLCLLATTPAEANEPDLRKEALRVLKKAASFYHDKASSHGGYVYYYSVDLTQRWGEGRASLDMIFVQPPGTPTVGNAYLDASAATDDKFYLDAARDTAEALVYGQLESGGWTQVIHFGPAKQVGKYRNGRGGKWNVSSLDDGQTQAALMSLMRTDQALNFKNPAIHEAAEYGLKALLKAQFPNGAFPQVWTGPVAAKPVVKAKFPDYDWRTEGRVKNYWDYYTLNDNLAGTVAETLLAAHRIYKDEKYLTALKKLGDFLILAQMPDPQPGWCQQYNYDMVPVWARKFEPPAITAWESQDVLETLIKIHLATGEKKYLEPIPKALEYYQKCVQADGKVARYYEFKSNKPLFMDAKYQLTYDASAAPIHYGWKQTSRFDEIEKRYQAAKNGKVPARSRSGKELEDEVRRIIREMDQEGRWITTYAGEGLVGQPKFANGFRFLSSDVFGRNVGVLSEYLAVTVNPTR
ncbi:MAG: pectate lyase [Planctomycetes bacterium]|nr:pectate lyase [Planctomycetota bacterium]